MTKMLRLYKIKALIYRDWVTMSKTKHRIIEILFFPVTTALIWGLFANYFKAFSLETAMMLLVINVFWSFSFLSQSSANMQINMDVWSRSLNQLLVSGITEAEYIVARVLFSINVSLIILALMLWIISWFGFVMPALGPFLLLVFVTLMASTALGILIVALYIRLGREYSFLTWSFLQLIILLSAPFFPVETYPAFMHGFVRMLPHTWIFEALRGLATHGALTMSAVFRALMLSVIYLVIVFPFYMYTFRKARKTGALVRLGF
ncbi:ABC transporter permease [Candidatus Woesearchaeota archaeon]|nr:ABC transporter permease [Candidatus Woesearchaeota archaeon]